MVGMPRGPYDALPRYFDPQPAPLPRRPWSPASLFLPIVIALAVMLAGFALGAVVLVGVR